MATTATTTNTSSTSTSTLEKPSSSTASPSPSPTSTNPTRHGLFAVPPPIARLFNHFPLRTYPAEPLPLRAPRPISSSSLDGAAAAAAASTSGRPRLYVFASHDDAVAGRPSFNPSCLKWQTYLRIAGIEVDLVSSNNHASPSGSLPFLIPSPTSTSTPASSSSSSSSTASGKPSAIPLTGDKIRQFARDNAQIAIPEVDSSARLQAYQALLAQNVRPAWLHALYLNPTNTPLLQALYLPSSPFLSTPLSHTVRSAATSEILSTTRRAIISPSQLRADLLSALRSLSALLGDHDDDEWFFGLSSPGIFDAEVFAYTHLILDEELGWRDGWMAECVREFENLVRHRARLLDRCWGV